MLALGTALAGFGYVFAGFSTGVVTLVAALFIGGLGASTQHPLASSLIAHAFAGSRSLKALGTYNFAGDIGKMTLPAAAALLFVVLPWRHALMLLGSLGAVAALVIFVAIPRFTDRESLSSARVTVRRTGRGVARRLWLSAAALDWRHRQCDAHGISDIPAFRAHRKGRKSANRRPRAHVGVCRWGGRQTGLCLHRRPHRRCRDGVADRGGDRAWHCGAAAAAA